MGLTTLNVPYRIASFVILENVKINYYSVMDAIKAIIHTVLSLKWRKYQKEIGIVLSV